MYCIYTDGACSGNNSTKQCPGGFGYVIVDAPACLQIEGGGSCLGTTNNRMELSAAIAGLTTLKQYTIKNNQPKPKCIIYTDSRYVCDNYNDYFESWKKKGWRKASGGLVLNVDLWKELGNKALDFESVEFQWVKGHADNQYNNRADEIARSYVERLKAK